MCSVLILALYCRGPPADQWLTLVQFHDHQTGILICRDPWIVDAANGGSPWTVAVAVLASGRGYQAWAPPAGGLKLLAVSQAFPGAGPVELGPAAVVRIIALVRASRKVGYAFRGDQQLAGGRRSGTSSFCQPMRAEFPVHLAELAVGHGVHDGVERQ